MSVHIALSRLHELITAALIAANTFADNARQVADALVAAEVDGIASHGVSRISFYADQARAGKVDGHAVPQIQHVAPSVVRVDACNGFAFPALRAGIETAATVARDNGVVMLGVTRSHHAGVGGYHAEQAAEQGLIALFFSNAPAAIAPWGGTSGTFGTNPIAFACPRKDTAPLVIDLSLSKAARGKVMVAQQQGKTIPSDWALDINGQPTTDPDAAMAGTMLPIGEAKGAALAMMVEILAAGLTGAHFAFQASSLFDTKGPPPGIGQSLILIDPLYLNAGFTDHLQALLGAILAQPGTRLPGERRLQHRAQAKQRGVSLPDALYGILCEQANRS